MPIKSEDITKEQAERFAELMDAVFGRFLNDYAAIPVEKIANVLIEAGIVSPPVWAVRNIKTGKLATHPMTRLKDLVPDKREPLVNGWEYEFWKGQAE
jgi:hypothetical protein